MRVHSIDERQVEIHMPNGARLLYVLDELQAAFIAGVLYLDSDAAVAREGDTPSLVEAWAGLLPVTERRERPRAHIVAATLMPSSIEFGDYGDADGRPVKAEPRLRTP